MDTVDELEAVLMSLRGIWDEEAVDELDHALQAGYLAHADRADDELLLASVLHDIGHSSAPPATTDTILSHVNGLPLASGNGLDGLPVRTSRPSGTSR